MVNNIFGPVIANGVPADVLYLLLLIPFIVMIASIARHVIGLKIFSMFVFVSMTLVIGFLLREYTMLSLLVSVGVLIFIYFFSYFIKRFTTSLALHYFSRISVVVTMISILLLGILIIVGRYANIVELLQLDKVSPFALVIAVLLSEYFSSNQTQKGLRASRLLFFYSLLLSIGVGVLLSWNQFEQFMFTYPYVIFGCMIITFLVGKYKGLRFTEFRRFKDIDVEERSDD